MATEFSTILAVTGRKYSEAHSRMYSRKVRSEFQVLTRKFHSHLIILSFSTFAITYYPNDNEEHLSSDLSDSPSARRLCPTSSPTESGSTFVCDAPSWRRPDGLPGVYCNEGSKRSEQRSSAQHFPVGNYKSSSVQGPLQQQPQQPLDPEPVPEPMDDSVHERMNIR